jgi:hypothetical protein
VGKDALTSTQRARAPRPLCSQPSMRRVLSLSPLLVLPALIGHTVANSPTFPNGTERDDNGTNVDADASMSKSASLESYCSAQLNSFVATYQSTEVATSRWTWYEGFGPTDSLGDLTGSVTSQTYWTSTFLCKCYHRDQSLSSCFLLTCFVSIFRIAVRKPRSYCLSVDSFHASNHVLL